MGSNRTNLQADLEQLHQDMKTLEKIFLNLKLDKMIVLKEAPTRNNKIPKTAEQICSQVLGDRPKLPVRSEETRYFEPFNNNLREELENTKVVIEMQNVELQAQKTLIGEQVNEIAYLKKYISSNILNGNGKVNIEV